MTRSLGGFVSDHGEEEHRGNNTHSQPIQITNVFKQVDTQPQEGREAYSVVKVID